MRATEFVTEEINPDILHPEFKHSQRIGDYLLTADHREGERWLNIRCYQNRRLVGKVDFFNWGGTKGYLASGSTEVHPDYRKQGIAYTMYAYARMLGNDISPSGSQSDDGKAMWAAWEKSGEAEHLMREARMLQRLLPSWTFSRSVDSLSGSEKYLLTKPSDITEEINPDILHPEFKHEQQIGDYIYTAESATDSDSAEREISLLRIRCYDGTQEIGSADFEVKGPIYGSGSDSRLESDFTWVATNHRQEGIASTMYAYAKMLGNDITPSSIQLAPGKKMWDAWKKSGDAEHLMKESIDTPYPIKWKISGNGDHNALALLPDGTELVITFYSLYDYDLLEKDDAWLVEFIRNSSYGVTGEGDSYRIFATVLSAIQQFIKKRKPKKLKFIASKTDENVESNTSRAKLYDRLVQRYANSLGYKIHRKDVGDEVKYEFTLLQNLKVNEINEARITELFNPKTSFPLTWDTQFATHGEVHAEAHDDKGRVISISFTPFENKNITGVNFTRGGTYEMSGHGDAAKVMATVINAIKMFVDKYQPPYLVFSAESKSGRANAYAAMIKRAAQGYRLLHPEQYPAELSDVTEFIGSDVPFVLEKI